ncbi:MAG: FIG00817400: hypothetical protein, partial [uncultured Friedmanniella sp.]
ERAPPAAVALGEPRLRGRRRRAGRGRAPHPARCRRPGPGAARRGGRGGLPGRRARRPGRADDRRARPAVGGLRRLPPRGRPAAPGAAGPAGPLRRRPGDHPQVPRQDQRAVHPAAHQRHAGLGHPPRHRAALRPRPDVRPRHHAEHRADPRPRRGRRRVRSQGRRGLHRLPQDLSASQASQAHRRPDSGAPGGQEPGPATRRRGHVRGRRAHAEPVRVLRRHPPVRRPLREAAVRRRGDGRAVRDRPRQPTADGQARPLGRRPAGRGARRLGGAAEGRRCPRAVLEHLRPDPGAAGRPGHRGRAAAAGVRPLPAVRPPRRRLHPPRRLRRRQGRL